MRKFILFLFILFTTFLVFAETENIGIIATVNGEPVTLADVLSILGPKEAQLPLIYKGQELQKQIHKLRLEGLGTIVDRKLVYMSFKEQDFKLPREYVEDNLDNLLEAFNVESRQELQKILSLEGMSYSEFKARAYENAAVDALIYSNCYRDVFITPKQVFDYYEQHKKEFTTPESLELSVITLKTTGVHSQDLEPLSIYLQKTLKDKGSDEFKEAVNLYSDGPALDRGGNIGWIPVDQLRKAFHVVLKDAKKGKVYGPIKSKEAYYFIRVDGVKQQHVESYIDSKDNIREKLTREAHKETYKNYIDRLKSKAIIKYYI